MQRIAREDVGDSSVELSRAMIWILTDGPPMLVRFVSLVVVYEYARLAPTRASSL
jgi:hypothetical protein